MAEELNFGQLSDESFLKKDIRWKIPNFISIPHHVNHSIDSPAFTFANATWCLRMYPNGELKKDNAGYIDLSIVRLHSSVSKHRIFLKFALMTRYDEEYENFNGIMDIEENALEQGILNFIKRSRLVSEENVFTSNGTVILCCQMCVKERSGVESSFQTEQTWSICKLQQDYKELLVSEKDSNVIIKVKGQQFRVHKHILCVRSSVFASMFKNNMKESITGIVDVDDCDPTIFSDFLCFLYTGSVEELSSKNVFGLYIAADKYDVQDLKLLCVQFMKSNLSVDIFCDVITLSLKHSETELTEAACDFFTKNLPQIIVTLKWQAFLIENPMLGNDMFIKALAA